MTEPRVVNLGLAACSDRPVAGAAGDAPTLPPEAARSAGNAQSAQSAQNAQNAQSAQSAHTNPIDPIDPSALADRERWLFRHVTRAGQVHPLRHLLKRYRAGERA